MAYSLDFRERSLAMIEEGKSISEVSRIMKVRRGTIREWQVRHEQGQLAAFYPDKRKPYKIDEEKLKSYVEKHPDAYLDEIAQEIGSNPNTVYSALKRLKITRKKRPRNTENVMKKSEQHTKRK